MAVTAAWFGKALNKAFGGEVEGLSPNIDWLTDSIKLMLLTNLASPDQDTWEFKDDVTNEVTGTGYTAGGQALTNKTLSYIAATNVNKFDADDVVWSNSTITARYGILYDDTPAADADKPLIGFIDFGADVVSADGPFTVAWHTDGIGTLTAAAPA